MDQGQSHREGLPEGRTLAAVTPTVNAPAPAQAQGQGRPSDERRDGPRRQDMDSMDTSMDDTASSSTHTHTPLPTSPSVEASVGTGGTDRQTSAGTVSNPEALLPPRRKRNRPAKSCYQCRQRKIRCDRKYPCGSCLRARFDNCTYSQSDIRSWPVPNGPPLSPASTAAPHAPPHPHQQPLLPTGSGQQGAQYSHTAAYPPQPPHPPPSQPYPVPRTAYDSGYPRDIAPELASSAHAPPQSSITNSNGTAHDTGIGLQSVIQELRQQLAQQASIIQQLRQGKGQDQAATDRTAGGNVSGQVTDSASAGVRGHMLKSRFFGQSHWMNGVAFFPHITGVVQKINTDKDQVYLPLMAKCKHLAKSIKQARVGSAFSFDIGKGVPEEPVARRLLNAYFRTFETVYRILHVPTFWDEYHQYWTKPTAASEAFVVQMQLCMAIGTCFEEDVVGLRHLATQWIYEAQFWLAPPEKSRVNISALQIMCLLHLAREACGIGGDLTWISSGSLMRCAMYMGLHHDPDQLGNMSILRAELRRRLWATILEIALQSSLDSGGPPMISPSDYDTKQPGNFDDSQLVDGERSAAISARPSGCFTETSVQLTLLRSFPTRLSVAKYINDFHTSASYEQTSRLNAQLQQVSATLQHSYDPAGVLPKRMTLFQLRLAEHMVHRFFLALNQPCLGQARNNADYWFARKACVESARKLCEGFSKAASSGEGASVDDFVRLSIAGAGAFRSVPVQCMMIIGVELLWQALDDNSVRSPAAGHDQGGIAGPVMGAGIGVAPRGELLEALQVCLGFQKRRLSCGETNVKCYIFFSALLAQVQALLRGAPDSEVEHIILDSMRATLQHCWELLKGVAGATATPPAPADPANAWPETAPGSQGVTDMFGFDGGWDWDEDKAFDFTFDFLNYSDLNTSFSFE